MSCLPGSWSLMTTRATPYGRRLQAVLQPRLRSADFSRFLQGSVRTHSIPGLACRYCQNIFCPASINTSAFARNPVGSHSYKLDQWRHGENLTLSRTRMPRKPSQNRPLISRIIPDRRTVPELSANNIDTMGLNPIRTPAYSGRPDLAKNCAL